MPLVHKIAEQFGIDRLIIQDIVDTNQRPKVEVYPEYLFVSVKSLLPSNQHNIDSEQISFILMGNVILSFQENREIILNTSEPGLEKEKEEFVKAEPTTCYIFYWMQLQVIATLP
nr:CorA family divalent cation transporter [Marinilabilia salmonicolor]